MSDAVASQEAPTLKQGTKSYGQILRSTTLIGASYLIVTAISIVRMKAVAVLLGPAGVGLTGLYFLISDLANSVASMGVPSSGVRQISEASGSGDERRIGVTVAAVKALSLLLGVLGAVGLAVASVPLSWITFGSEMQAGSIAVLGLAVLFRVIGAAPGTILQGLRRTRELAVANIASTLAGAVVMVLLIYWFGAEGIAPAMALGAATAFGVALHYARKVPVAAVPLREAVRDQAGPLFRMGFVFMVSGLLMTGGAYLIRIIVLHADGVHAAGLYQSGWGVAALYAGFVLQAMGTDFYPRLTEVASQNVEVNRLVNEQARVSLLLAGPGVIGTIALAPAILSVFYSAEFVEAQALLRWFCLGMMLRVVAWPMGFVVLAKGANRAFFWTELAAALVQVGLAVLLVPWIGMDGAGLAFVGLYVWHTVVIYLVVRVLSGFRWSRGNIVLAVVYLLTTMLAILGFWVLGFWPATVLGTTLAVVTGLYSVHEIMVLAPELVPRPFRPLVALVIRRASRG